MSCNNSNSSIQIIQSGINTIQISAPGPQGPPGPAGSGSGQIPFLRNALTPVIQSKKSKLLIQLDQELGDFESLHQHLMTAIVENPPVLLRDGNVIAEGYDAELDELRQIRDHAGQFLIDLEIKERERTGINTLKIGYNRVSGYYIELTRAQAEQAKAHAIIAQVYGKPEPEVQPSGEPPKDPEMVQSEEGAPKQPVMRTLKKEKV